MLKKIILWQKAKNVCACLNLFWVVYFYIFTVLGKRGVRWPSG